MFIFYDLECQQDTIVGVKQINDENKNIYKHDVNLCVAQQVCENCFEDENINSSCAKCKKRQHIFKENPVNDFIEYVIIKSMTFDVTAIAHNMQGYDGIFILKELLTNFSNRLNPSIIKNGAKLISISCNDIRFIDSLNFMAQPLSQLPSTFKFNDAKGYFPHFFNTKANENYIGPLPDPIFYGAKGMKPKEHEKFMKWYNEQIEYDVIFNMQVDLEKYCIQDVNILRLACTKFRKCFLTANNVDPFREATTIASACNTVFRKNFLKTNTIGVIPQGGYRLKDNQSAIALKWLYYMEFSLKNSFSLSLQHAGNGHEIRLREGLLVDGYCEGNNTVYEFHGCFYHGCKYCFSNQVTNVSTDDNETTDDNKMYLRRERTLDKENKIKTFGYNLVTMWECDFRRIMKNDLSVALFLAQNSIMCETEPLNPRDGFFGGRTNVVTLYKECETEEEICYFDVCSLYPYVNKYGKYPVGHPTVHVGEANCRNVPLDTVEGLIKCTVLPPSQLYHPVLPYRFNSKLTFPLCRTCLEEVCSSDCNHNENEKAISGVFVAEELRLAIRKGYRILSISEIWEYKVTQYDRETKTGGLFTEYINNFLKIKQESSGWPGWCVSSDDKAKYIKQYYEREGVQLDENNISKNAGLRYNAKIMLNSFWGKFGQRENLMQTTIVTNQHDLYKYLNDPSFEVHTILPINDENVMVTWGYVSEAVKSLRTVNVAIAAYTTSNARLELYKYLEQLDRRVLYFDTDSIIFTKKAGEWVPSVGDYLGDLTDELEDYGPGSYISEFVSGGPKNYAYKVISPSTGQEHHVCKVKGITLNYENSKKINFESIKNMIRNDPTSSIFVYNDRKIARTKNFEIVSRPEKKIYQAKVTKRRRLNDSFRTLPFGYKEIM